LPEGVNGKQYCKALQKAIERIEAFGPQFLVVAFGLDPAKGDPTGTWSLGAQDFEQNGLLIGALGLPTVVVQEGGYRTRTLGRNAFSFFKGLALANSQWVNDLHRAKAVLVGMHYRAEVHQQDLERIRRLVEITGFFSAQEVDLAVELVSDRLARGPGCGYHFLIAEHYGRLIGYTCYGPIPCTSGSYDLYWIAVHPDFHRRGVGRSLVEETEKLIRAAGGSRIYVDTSQRVQYASTRAFYEGCGYHLETVLTDFYAPGDGKAIYCKSLV
jgi:GNAT superfamily N-acetyltransferase